MPPLIRLVRPIKSFLSKYEFNLLVSQNHPALTAAPEGGSKYSTVEFKFILFELIFSNFEQINLKITSFRPRQMAVPIKKGSSLRGSGSATLVGNVG